MTLNDYMVSKYVDAGRIWPDLDCYGLARLVRHDVYGKSLLPMLGGHGGKDKVKQTTDVMRNIYLLDKTDNITAECLVFAFRRKLCEHIGVVVSLNGIRRVMDINQHTGVRIVTMSTFDKFFNRVEYYD